jgi:hypothetical protein
MRKGNEFFLALRQNDGPNDRFWPILLKKSRRDFCSRKCVVDVEIWFAQKA